MKLLFLLIGLSLTLQESSLPSSVKNLHRVSNDLYRSAQPDKKDMKSLENFGIKTIINLRLRCDDKQEIKGTSLVQKHIKIKTSKMTYDNMVEAMRAFDKAEKPALVHCRRGSDRTGCFVACYRIAYENWPKQQALDSFLTDGLGYYEHLFPNLRQFVEELDIDQFKKDVFQQ